MVDRRGEFGMFRRNPELVYLDYAATTFMPDRVMEAWNEYQSNVGVSIGRGNHPLSIKAAEIFDSSGRTILDYFNAGDSYDISYTKNATESANLLADAFGSCLGAGDIVLMSPYEHHSNILPWKRAADERGACIVMFPVREDGSLQYDFAYKLDLKRVKAVSVTMVSNVTSYLTDMERIKQIAEDSGAYVIWDISQAAGHMPIDCEGLGADAYFMSAHKMYGPKNIGGVLIRKERLEELPPFLLGGGMVWNALGGRPKWQAGGRKYIAGTIDVGLVHAWAEACRYIGGIGMGDICAFERTMHDYAKARLGEIKGIEWIRDGGASSHSLCSFVLENVHPHDLDQAVSGHNIALRTGHMCSQNSLETVGKESVCRISWGIGSSLQDIDRLREAVRKGFGI